MPGGGGGLVLGPCEGAQYAGFHAYAKAESCRVHTCKTNHVRWLDLKFVKAL